MSRTSKWVFTANASCVFDLPFCVDQGEAKPRFITQDDPAWSKLSKVEFAAFQYELNTNHGLHVQGYVEFKDEFTFHELKAGSAEFFGRASGRLHLERSRKGRKANQRYCNKEETRLEGTEPFLYCQARQRTNLKPDDGSFMRPLLQLIQNGYSFDDMLAYCADEECEEMGTRVHERMFVFLIQQQGKIKQMIEVAKKTALQRSGRVIMRTVRVEYVHGTPGTGKTTAVYKNYTPYGIYRKTKTMEKWYLRYSGEKVLIVDDFTDWIPIEEMLQVCDGKEFIIQDKGVSMFAEWHMVFIISNLSFEHLYNDWEGVPAPLREALRSRISKFNHVRGPCMRNAAAAPALPVLPQMLYEVGYDGVETQMTAVAAGGNSRREVGLERYIRRTTPSVTEVPRELSSAEEEGYDLSEF
jgi:hypothetical protein